MLGMVNVGVPPQRERAHIARLETELADTKAKVTVNTEKLDATKKIADANSNLLSALGLTVKDGALCMTTEG